MGAELRALAEEIGRAFDQALTAVETDIYETCKRFNSLMRRISRLAVDVHDTDAEASEGS